MPCLDGTPDCRDQLVRIEGLARADADRAKRANMAFSDGTVGMNGSSALK